MIPAKFEYKRATSVEEAVSLLREHGEEAKLLAGGHSLLPLMKLRLATPEVLIDIAGIEGLSHITDGGGHVSIGAFTRYRDLQTSELLNASVPLLAHVAGEIGDPQVRHRGTIGGSIAHADPAADLPAVALTLDATLIAQGPDGTRTIAAKDFFQGFLETALESDEVLTEIRVPKTSSAWAFEKFRRRAIDWAIVGVTVAQVGGSFKIGLINMGSTPLRASAVERALEGGSTIEQASLFAADGTDPSADGNASTEYREHLARVLVRRALEEAVN